MTFLRLSILTLLFAASPLLAQQASPWHDPSPHKVQFVTADKDVKLEVLDWGGTGRPIVLLAGLGNTAHVFDDFAPKLTSEYHVYGITRRGFGASTAPTPDATNYSADRLGDDVIAVLDALKINKVVLAGHSLGGEELTSVANRHGERVGGLIYLDAGFAYAYYDAARTTDILKDQIDWNELKGKIELVLSGKDKTQQKSIGDLLNSDLPTFEKELQQFEEAQFLNRTPVPIPKDTPDDDKTFGGFHAYYKRTFGLDIPEAQLREWRQTTPDGGVGPPTNKGLEIQAIMAGMQKFTEIKAPVLAIFAGPHEVGPYGGNDPAVERYQTLDADYMKHASDDFQKAVPSARVLLLPHASHYVFLSNEADVLREMRSFINGLPEGRAE